VKPTNAKMKTAGADERENSTAELERELIAWGEKIYKQDSHGRFAEQREWLEEALFYQRRQWLEWNDDKKTYTLIPQDKAKPRPMPVSNYFAKAVNACANSYGRVRVVATPDDDSYQNRRAAEYSEKAAKAIDKESGFELQIPLLSKHRALWGMGVTVDVFDDSHASGVTQIEDEQIEKSMMLGCIDCGGSFDMGPMPEGQEGMMQGGEMQGQMPCPRCGSQTTLMYPQDTAVPMGTESYGKGKIRTEVRPIFEFFLPRDCTDPNSAARVERRYRQPISKLKRMYGERAAGIKGDQKSEAQEAYAEALRSLVNYNFMHENAQDCATVTEVWARWDELPKDLQDQIAEFDGEIAGLMQRWGMFVIYAGEKVLDFGVNNNYDEDTDECYTSPYTFFPWEADPANVYNKGAGADLVPAQKRLNRLDSLIELAFMTNAVGKWLWPKTQTTKPPSGDPSDVAEYDPIGDGKMKPEFVLPSPVSPQVWQLRNAILQDFVEIANIAGIEQGDAGGAKAFRAIAYLGAKAEESKSTQRYLWEQCHLLRYKKILLLARKGWDEQRKVRVSGWNGRYVTAMLSGDDLKGACSVDFVPDSSRPRLLAEKMELVSMMIQSGLVDPTDPSTRQYIMDFVNLEGLNLADDLQFRKAERDLEKLKRGEMPFESPFQKWDIFLKFFALYTLTEEFETLDPNIQAMVLAYTEYINLKVTMASMPAPSAMMGGAGALPPGSPNAQVGAALDPNKRPEKTLSKVPGQGASVASTQAAAKAEGAAVAAGA